MVRMIRRTRSIMMKPYRAKSNIYEANRPKVILAAILKRFEKRNLI